MRIPVSPEAALEKIAAEDGTSMSQLVVCAVAEKISALTTADYFAEHRTRADRGPTT